MTDPDRQTTPAGIIDRLIERAAYSTTNGPVMREAASEIERLRGAINRALEQLDHPGGWMAHIREPLEAAVQRGPAA